MQSSSEKSRKSDSFPLASAVPLAPVPTHHCGHPKAKPTTSLTETEGGQSARASCCPHSGQHCQGLLHPLPTSPDPPAHQSRTGPFPGASLTPPRHWLTPTPQGWGSESCQHSPHAGDQPWLHPSRAPCPLAPLCLPKSRGSFAESPGTGVPCPPMLSHCGAPDPENLPMMGLTGLWSCAGSTLSLVFKGATTRVSCKGGVGGQRADGALLCCLGTCSCPLPPCPAPHDPPATPKQQRPP